MGLPDKPGDKDLRQRPANSTGGVVVLTRPYQIVQLIAVVLLNYVHQSATGIGSPEKVQDPTAEHYNHPEWHAVVRLPHHIN
jgi:hypothetical protein